MLLDIDKLKELVPVSKSLSIEKVGMFIDDAEEIIENTISSAFYAELLAYTSGDTVTDELILKLQKSISYICLFLGFDIMNAFISNQGFARIESEKSGTKSMFQRQEENLKETFKRSGYNKLDSALTFLETNKANFETWTSSDEYTLSLRNFINSATVFNSIFGINKSRLVFIKLRPAITLAEDMEILPLIGRAFFDELKLQILDDTLTAKNQKVVDYIQKTVAYATIARGGYSLLGEINEYGVIKIESGTNTANYKTKSQIEKSAFDVIIDNAESNAKAYKSSINGLMRANIADYPTYAASSAYNEAVSLYDGIKGSAKFKVI